MLELLVVLGRLCFSSFANVFQKKLAHDGFHPFYIVLATYVVLAVLCVPLLWTFNTFQLSSYFWLNIFFAALLDMAGTLFLVMSLSKTDLSVFGPLNAYKVVFSMILAWMFLAEVPSFQGLMGVLIILVGSFFLFPKQHYQGNVWVLFSERGVQFRFLSILLFSIGTLPLKNAVIEGGAMPTTVFWCLIGLPLAAFAQAAWVRENTQQDLAMTGQHVYDFIYVGVLVFLMQYMTMLVFAELLVAYSLALFQLSMVLHVFLGYRIFNEPHVWQRLSACLVMVAGSILVLNA